MRVRHWCAIGVATFLGGAAAAQTPTVILPPATSVQSPVIVQDETIPWYKRAFGKTPADGTTTMIVQEPGAKMPAEGIPAPKPADGKATPAPAPAAAEAKPEEPKADDCPAETWGPTPLPAVKILQGCLADKCNWFAEMDDPCTGKKKAPCLTISGWVDLDYTYYSTGPGQSGPGPGLAPVMNRFGDEFLDRQMGLYLSKPLDAKELSWGFNSIFIGGADASFLTPTAGGWRNTNPRFGGDWTDLNVTAHLPILTDGGVDIKAGRQTTVLGPMGALPWQRYFDSSDYTWYNEEEGRYTGVSAVWHVNKRLDWYNGIEVGGWGVFFDNPSGPDYITQINYWLDCEAKKTLFTFTCLTGPTGTNGGNTTVVELCLHQNWTDRIYQVVDTHLLYSKAPLFFIFAPPPNYQERSYSIYNYLGYHLTKELDVNTRVEWYQDIDGGAYPGGFSHPKTNYWEVTLGVDYHPVKWLQLRPEVRGDFSNNNVFGNFDQMSIRSLQKDQLSLACDALFKF